RDLLAGIELDVRVAPEVVGVLRAGRLDGQVPGLGLLAAGAVLALAIPRQRDRRGRGAAPFDELAHALAVLLELLAEVAIEEPGDVTGRHRRTAPVQRTVER